MPFCLNLHTEIDNPFSCKAIQNAVNILKRDMKKTLLPCENISNSIRLMKDSSRQAETYQITVCDDSMTISANDSLGFVYGLLSVSEKYLGVKPFWFWMDSEIAVQGSVLISQESYSSPAPAVRYRGWFINDEVLLMGWDTGFGKDFAWRMAFEALLRCGGNMVIPGTDKNSRAYRKLAAETGLWITHHHAEPLGAEMFSRAFPTLTPAYEEHPELFERLWEDAIIEQKEDKTVWALGFRGQGDCPFWEGKGEEIYDTPEKQGKLISDLIETQRQMICKHIQNPVFCTNLYGEVMELYNDGHITLHPDIIKVWADNGYGKMVTRRRGNHCARVRSLPRENDGGSHGAYYHVSFHDLQAAGLLTALPNSVSFVNKELHNAMRLGVDDYWIINCSNIRPHVYYLDAVRKLWYGQSVCDESHGRDFAENYYSGNAEVGKCLQAYPDALIAYGKQEDEHAGDEFYNYSVRAMVRQFITDKAKGSDELIWLTGDITLTNQAKKIMKINQSGSGKLQAYYKQCQTAGENLNGKSKRIFDATVLLQAKIHHYCNAGAILFCQAFEEIERTDYQRAFYFLGRASESFELASFALRESEYGIWKGFYQNDCLTDIKFTAYIIRSMMHVIRILGDDDRFAAWYEDFVCSQEDNKVRLLSITENHMTDETLFEVMKLAAR